MTSQRERKLSSSSISTQGSQSPKQNCSSKWILKGEFVYHGQKTQVFVYNDQIVFSNIEELTILKFKTFMVFQTFESQNKLLGFKLIADQEHIFQNKNWLNYQKWIEILSQKLIRRGFSQFYNTKRKIGQGSFGKVYLCEQISSHELVAVKVILKSKTVNLNKILKNEINSLRKISHQNIVKLKGVCETQQAYYLITEYFEGTSLEQFLFENRLFLYQRKQILSKLLDAIDCLHSSRIIHRDIKPSNILINPLSKEIKLIDFGLSVEFEQFQKNNTQRWAGTLGYIAPEYLKRLKKYIKFQDVSKIDMYSIGAVFYQMILNKKLHNGFTSEQIKCMNQYGKVDFNLLSFIAQQDQIDLLKAFLQSNSSKRISLQKVNFHWYLNQNSQNSIMSFQEWKANQQNSHRQNFLNKFISFFNKNK